MVGYLEKDGLESDSLVYDTVFGRQLGVVQGLVCIIIIIPTPLCPRACRTFKLFTVQENRALASRMKNL